MKLTLCVVILFFVLIFAVPTMAAEQENPKASKLPEIAGFSIGIGPHWGGIAGVNYAGVPEGSNIGYSVGAGFGGGEFGFNVGGVYRISAHKGVFVTYGTAAIETLSWGDEVIDEGIVNGFNLMYGSLPKGSDFIWRLGVSFPQGYNAMFDAGIGWSFSTNSF